MTDQEIATNVRNATASLNAALQQAGEAGINVQVFVTSVNHIGAAADQRLVEVLIHRWTPL